MSLETKPRHVTPVGGNVFADLGFEPREAAALKAQSQRIVSQKLAIKESLMTELARWIEAKGLRQAEAAQIFGVTRPRVSDLINN
jgi:predicted XRE-type DNA-binding protein